MIQKTDFLILHEARVFPKDQKGLLPVEVRVMPTSVPVMVRLPAQMVRIRGERVLVRADAAARLNKMVREAHPGAYLGLQGPASVAA